MTPAEQIANSTLQMAIDNIWKLALPFSQDIEPINVLVKEPNNRTLYHSAGKRLIVMRHPDSTGGMSVHYHAKIKERIYILKGCVSVGIGAEYTKHDSRYASLAIFDVPVNMLHYINWYPNSLIIFDYKRVT